MKAYQCNRCLQLFPGQSAKLFNDLVLRISYLDLDDNQLTICEDCAEGFKKFWEEGTK